MVAPVLLFALNRPVHTRRTLDALAGNALASETKVHVIVDGGRTDAEAVRVEDTCGSVGDVTRFKSVRIVRQGRNPGLAKNIVAGITEVIEACGEVIVLEDDLVTSRAVLTFIDRARDRNCDEPRMWHVGGYNDPCGTSSGPQTFFWRVMRCRRWGTWAGRWKHFKEGRAGGHESLRRPDATALRSRQDAGFLGAGRSQPRRLHRYLGGVLVRVDLRSRGHVPESALVVRAQHRARRVRCPRRVALPPGTNFPLNASGHALWPDALVEDVVVTEKLKEHYRGLPGYPCVAAIAPGHAYDALENARAHAMTASNAATRS